MVAWVSGSGQRFLFFKTFDKTCAIDDEPMASLLSRIATQTLISLHVCNTFHPPA